MLKHGLVGAAIMNIGGVLIFSRGFTNNVINNADPVVMSNFGLLMIVIWGLAYLGAAYVKSSIKWLAGVFAIEKLVYVLVWLRWISENSLAPVYEADVFAGVFFTVYGVNDLVFMVFFSWVFIKHQTLAKT